MIRVVIADDQEMVRMGFELILAAAEGIEVVASCPDGAAAVEAIRREKPDVALLDIRMPKLDGLSVARSVAGSTRVVIVTTFGDDAYVDEALDAGAVGFLLKDSGPDLLVAAVRAAAAGDALISPQLTVSLLQRRGGAKAVTRAPGIDSLTDRELEVARLVAHGLTNAEIQNELFVSLGTVKSHLANIQTRLGARNRVEVAASIWRAGLAE